MSPMNQPGPRPAFPVVNGPVPGPVAVQVLKVLGTPKGEGVTVSTICLGPGRDAADLQDAKNRAREFTAMQSVVRATVGEQFDTVSALLAEWPEAQLDPIARGMLAVERAKGQHAEAVAKWAAAVEAIGHEACDRCGGAGGYQGWPGFTCYECDGVGHVPKGA